MKIKKTNLKDLFVIHPFSHADDRGKFVKTFNFDDYTKSGLNTVFQEEYFSVSKKGVLRGMHFQAPPFEHNKLVYCIYGSVLDVVLDLRKSSGTYGRHEKFHLNEDETTILYIPSGLAHGFYSLEDNSILVYKTSTVYNFDHDMGIKWDSAKISWPDNDPLISDRDNDFQNFADFDSPFE